MSSAPLYDFSIVPFTRSIKSLLAIFDKAEQYAKENGENVEDYINLQIHPDMKKYVSISFLSLISLHCNTDQTYSFGYQIQRLTDSAKFVVVRVAGADPEPLSIPDEEKTWSDFRARLEKTVKILEAAKAEDFVGKEGIELSLFGGKYQFTGTSYLQNFAVPNFYFHVTTAYDLLRAKGVPIGKQDYLGAR